MVIFENYSVVIPCYNSSKTLFRTLESIRHQNSKPLEVLAIDNGSTDETLSVLNSYPYAHELGLRILQEQKRGPAHARNKGIRSSQAQWVAFLDSDDQWKPNHIERVKMLVAQSTKSIAYMSAVEHFSLLENRVVSQSDTHAISIPLIDLDHASYFELYQKYGILEFSTVVILRSRLLEINAIDSELSGGDDLDLWLRAIYKHRCIYDPTPTSTYTCGNPQSWTNKDPGINPKLVVYAKLKEAYKIHPLTLQSIAKTSISQSLVKRSRIHQLKTYEFVKPFLPIGYRILFGVALRLPWLFRLIHFIRAKIRGEVFPPRIVIQQ